ncbi:MAG TPA: NAD-dependent epimerase/dehydratase family protein [Terracidiphilus sp.]|nr:NAD-dependent epimerase/dehydratase family protein [Terracidiphilus sp.]
MKRVLITGGRGFLGSNLATRLLERNDCETTICDQDDTAEDLKKWALDADIIFHLAGVNRPLDPAEFESGNTRLMEQVCEWLREGGRSPKIVFSSSIQAELDNPYGVSKAKAEDVLQQFSSDTGACVRIYRLKNLFGKWCRPNYNSVTATFCHNIANDQAISISDPEREIELSYVDDVVGDFVAEIAGHHESGWTGEEIPSYRIRLGDLAGRIQAFHEMSSTLTLPDFADWFNRALYATYLSYVPPAARQHSLEIKSDARGSLGEFAKQKHFGQIFVSRTKPGVTRGNHYHHTKTEKFFVVEGNGLIRMRAIRGGPVEEYSVSGSGYQVIDIPPGFTHSITNVGAAEMVTLFWSSEMFDPSRPDTYYLPVESPSEGMVASLESV